MIPAQAVEAAAKAIYESRGRFKWDDVSELMGGAKESTRKEALAALEAAAPHMIKSAYDLGLQHGSNQPPNPYSSPSVRDRDECESDRPADNDWHEAFADMSTREYVPNALPNTHWGTDAWGEVLPEPSEDHARNVAKATGAKLYSRPPMGAWQEER